MNHVLYHEINPLGTEMVSSINENYPEQPYTPLLIIQAVLIACWPTTLDGSQRFITICTVQSHYNRAIISWNTYNSLL